MGARVLSVWVVEAAVVGVVAAVFVGGCGIWLPRVSAAASAACQVDATTGAGRQPPALDVSAARDAIAFLKALDEGRPWTDEAIRAMVARRPYAVMVAHHSRMDSRFTVDALASVYSAVRDGRAPSAGVGERLQRVGAALAAARARISELEAWLAVMSDPDLLSRAVARARAALPGRARLDATVYVVADGRSSGYAVGREIVVDLLQPMPAYYVETLIAHELHHVGACSLLPETPPAEGGVGVALEVVAAIAHEGAATRYIDGWRPSAAPGDFEAVSDFLEDALLGKLDPLDKAEVARRRSQLVAGQYGPIYQVGGEMVAALAGSLGDRWVYEHLGDPIAMLWAWRSVAIERGLPCLRDGVFEELAAVRA